MIKNRLLVVEDDPDISEIIAMNLQYSGYEYITLDDGAKAAEYMRGDHAFDMAVLDIMLPGIDGFELMEHMRRYDIPVLYLTARADLASKIKGLRDGAEDYLVKPFEVLELLVRIEKILERTGKLNKILRCRDIVIDIEVPQGNYVYQSSAADGKLTINADAPVTVPESEKIPTARVTETGLTQEPVTAFFNYLFPGEKPLYEIPCAYHQCHRRQHNRPEKRLLADACDINHSNARRTCEAPRFLWEGQFALHKK